MIEITTKAALFGFAAFFAVGALARPAQGEIFLYLALATVVGVLVAYGVAIPN